MLWNLASYREGRSAMLSLALAPLMEHVLLPYMNDMLVYLRQLQETQQQQGEEQSERQQRGRDSQSDKLYWSTVFRNATGVLR